MTEEQRRRMEEYLAKCKEHRHPDFLMGSPTCFACGHDHTKNGTITPPYNTTGCPACHRSYCD